MAAIYKFYETGIKKVDSEGSVTKVSKNYTYVCKFCKEKGFKLKGNFSNIDFYYDISIESLLNEIKIGQPVTISAVYPITSNLIKHLNSQSHAEVLREFNEACVAGSNYLTPVKRSQKQLEFYSVNTPKKSALKQSLLFKGGVTSCKKYGVNDIQQKTR
jgi:hypothetical protein